MKPNFTVLVFAFTATAGCAKVLGYDEGTLLADAGSGGGTGTNNGGTTHSGGSTNAGGTTTTGGTGVAGNGLGGTVSAGGTSNKGGTSAAGAGGVTTSSGGGSAPTATGGTSTTGGSPSAGGTKTAGGTTGTGGMAAPGGNVSTGGAATGGALTGGSSAAGGSSGSGCTGSFETIQSGGAGLCVAKMVPITGPPSDAGSTDYGIDATEVTKGQYDVWLGTNPALPASTDANCSYVKSYAEQASGGALYTGTDADHHPVADVDWCDAYAYCKGVGKRLCGAIGGGSNAYASYDDATQSQWYRACSSAGVDSYPYGNTYQSTYCDGADYGTGQTVTVGSLAKCVTSIAGYAGAYDLSGNVREWEDSCNGTGPSAPCHVCGGGFVNYSLISLSSNLACGTCLTYGRNNVFSYYGFRCCSP